MAGDDQKSQELQLTVLSMLDGNGKNSVVLRLFPSAITQVMATAEWVKANPEAEHVEIVLHGVVPHCERPDALIMTMPRTALLVMAADMVRQEQGVTLQ